MGSLSGSIRVRNPSTDRTVVYCWAENKVRTLSREIPVSVEDNVLTDDTGSDGDDNLSEHLQLILGLK